MRGLYFLEVIFSAIIKPFDSPDQVGIEIVAIILQHQQLLQHS